MLNPDLDRAALAKQFIVDGRVRVENILAPEVAERIQDYCSNHLQYDYLTNIDGKNVVLTADEMKNLNQQQLTELQQSIMTQAAEGIGFFYCGYKIGREADDPADEKVRYLHSVFDFLNSDEMLSFVAEISGCTDLKSADAQYTRYGAGQFLTRHIDDETSDMRRLAYVISFTKDWHPDWGGLLQFFEDDGTPRDAWAPVFNSMTLFEVRHVHAVTFIAPFLKRPRLSLTGWFRASAL